MKEVTERFKKWTESISTSPSNRHLGNYRCLIKSNDNKNSSELKDFNETMLQVYMTIINAAITLGKPLHRCLLSIVIVIEKEKNNSKIH